MSLEDRIIFGGLYQAKNLKKVWNNYTSSGFDRNDQRYDLWVPIRFTGSDTVNPGIYMIDTYQLDGIYGSYEKIVNKLISYGENGDGPYYNSHNYYYSSRIRLTEEILDEFELIADLREWHQEDYRDVGNYVSDDVLCGVYLYREHCYPNGICLVRNNAKINSWNRVESLCDDILRFQLPCLYGSDRAKRELVQYLESVGNDAEYNLDRVEAVLELYDMIEKLEKQFDTEYRELKDRARKKTRYEWVHREEGGEE